MYISIYKYFSVAIFAQAMSWPSESWGEGSYQPPHGPPATLLLRECEIANRKLAKTERAFTEALRVAELKLAIAEKAVNKELDIAAATLATLNAQLPEASAMKRRRTDS